MLSSSCNQKRQIKKADDFSNIIRHGNDSIKNAYASIIFDKGLNYLQNNNYQEAKNCFFKADSAFPDSPVILNALANSLARTNYPNMAAENFERILLLDSNYVQTYVNYGCLLNTTGDLTDAKRIFLTGLRKKNKDRLETRLLYTNLANTYCLLNQKQTALILLGKAKAGLTSGELYDKITSTENEIKKKISSETTN